MPKDIATTTIANARRDIGGEARSSRSQVGDAVAEHRGARPSTWAQVADGVGPKTKPCQIRFHRVLKPSSSTCSQASWGRGGLRGHHTWRLERGLNLRPNSAPRGGVGRKAPIKPRRIKHPTDVSLGPALTPTSPRLRARPKECAASTRDRADCREYRHPRAGNRRDKPCGQDP